MPRIRSTVGLGRGSEIDVAHRIAISVELAKLIDSPMDTVSSNHGVGPALGNWIRAGDTWRLLAFDYGGAIGVP
jgi:hypothetical protein